jgi:transposase-like protein
MPPGKKPYKDMSLLDFQLRFPNEKACWKHLVRLRWPQRKQCFDCQGQKIGLIKTRKLFECRTCGKQMSVTAGTVFHKSRIPLRKWFWAIYLTATSKKGISALYLQRHLGLGTYRAAWLMAHKIRKAMLDRDELYQLKGKVQVDEIGVGGKRTKETIKKSGQNNKPFKGKTPFLMAVEEISKNRPRFLRVEELEDLGGDGVIPVIKKRIARGSTLKSDGAAVYRKVAKDEEYALEQSSSRRDLLSTRAHLRWVNMATSNMKRYLLSTYHGVYPKYRKAYAAEFAYRFNRRYWPYQAFDRLLYACTLARQMTLSELKA